VGFLDYHIVRAVERTLWTLIRGSIDD